MDWQTNKGKPWDNNVGIKNVFQDSSESLIRSDFVSKIKTIRTQNVNDVIGNLSINFLFSKIDDVKVFDMSVITENKTVQHFFSFAVLY